MKSLNDNLHRRVNYSKLLDRCIDILIDLISDFERNMIGVWIDKIDTSATYILLLSRFDIGKLVYSLESWIR